MPRITDTPPYEIEQDLEKLREKLDKTLPKKVLDQNLLIATWNIKAFGGLTEKWESEDGDSPKRDLQSLLSITEIVSRFDVIAIQEIRSNLKALRHMLKKLGPEWGVMLTDVTRGDKGNSERLGFIFDRRKVSLSGLACELVVAPEDLARDDTTDEKLANQFARTPYAVGFKAGGKTFILVTLHIYYGSEATADKKLRAQELTTIAEWLGDWALDAYAWDHNLIALGDFNIDRQGDPLYDAFTKTGLRIHPDLKNLRRTIFDEQDNPDPENFYDQIAWFTGAEDKVALSLIPLEAGQFDFADYVLQRRNLSNQSLAWHISDHIPLFVCFDIRDLPEDPSLDTTDEKRRQVIAEVPTALDNAIIAFLYEMSHNNLVVDDEAEDYLFELAFHSETLDICKKKIEDRKTFEKVPEEIVEAGINIANEVLQMIDTNERTNVTKSDVQQAIETLRRHSWPFNKAKEILG